MRHLHIVRCMPCRGDEDEKNIKNTRRMHLEACTVREILSRSLPFLLEILADLFHRYSQEDESLQQPPRSVLSVNESENCLLIKPCIDTRRGYMCVKTITVFPKSSPAIDGNVSLFDGNTGRLCLVADAGEITAIRTAATSFLATQLLALSKWSDDRKDKAVLTILGCGIQGQIHLEVFTSLFKWNKIYLWSRDRQNAVALQSKFSNTEILTDLNDVHIQESDVICTCTASQDALIGLKHVKPDVHINAIGSFRSNMRELADDVMLSSTTRIIVDSRESAMNEAGEIIQSKAKITAELGELIENEPIVREMSHGKLTIFKSVGLAIEDLAAAIVLYESMKK